LSDVIFAGKFFDQSKVLTFLKFLTSKILQRKSTFVLPMLVVNAILLIVVITSVIVPTMINDPGEPKIKIRRPELKFEDKLPHFSALMIVAFVFLFLCVWSLNDKFKSEENDRKIMAADKEAAANYGTNEK
jgi:H+/Cl- antiporter ClcA